MKLAQFPERRRRLGAKEAAGQVESDAPAEIIDLDKVIHSEEFEQYAKELAGPQPEEQRALKIVSAAWYGIIRPEYREVMRSSEWLKDFWLKYFKEEYSAAIRSQLKSNQQFSVKDSFHVAANFLQVFPESREDILRFIPNGYDWMLQNFGRSSGSFLGYDPIVLMLKLWPEKRAETLAGYFPDGIPTEIETPIDMWQMSGMVLAFPELRPQAQTIAQEQRPIYQSELAFWRQKFLDEEDGGFDYAYYTYIENLVILCAADAWIDAEGMEHIELTKKKLSKSVGLPERPGV